MKSSRFNSILYLFCLCNNFLVTKSKYWYGEHVQTCQECCFFGFFLLYIKKRNLKTIMKDLHQQKHVVFLFFVLCFFNFNFWNPNYPSTT